MLTTTISRYGDRIDRLTSEVAQLRDQEAGVRARLAVKQAELDRAMAELNGAKRHLAVMRAHLKRALVALRERLVAMYEMGTPDVLSVIVGSSGFDDLVNRTEYLNRLHGMDDAVVGRVRELRDEMQRTVTRLRTAKDRIKSARDAIAAQEQALATARAAVQSRQSALVAARAGRVAALAKIRKTRAGAGRLGRRDPGQDRRTAIRDLIGAAAGRANPQWLGAAHLAGRRAGRLRLRAAHDQRPATSTTPESTSRCRAARRSAPPRRGR